MSKISTEFDDPVHVRILETREIGHPASVTEPYKKGTLMLVLSDGTRTFKALERESIHGLELDMTGSLRLGNVLCSCGILLLDNQSTRLFIFNLF